ncbi:hypothetical protein DAPPUDRAFT_309240 [Daphnia pulex]|uniref:Uncharacterized protein n=1 Tax=Daphnia pulex TaxID=6669 RepID=E9HZE1_DAPPU|nr:hypothetical protein DAPPUDRAFT_309240 [Daphnia pulex]|eukprot:EFX62890.1 hypothetical protein DAPPUDRAFT_309240 [Daphnia pulex]
MDSKTSASTSGTLMHLAPTGDSGVERVKLWNGGGATIERNIGRSALAFGTLIPGYSLLHSSFVPQISKT